MFGEPTAAKPNQSPAPPGPLVSVTVTLPPPLTLVAFTASEAAVPITNGRLADVPPPCVKTVTGTVPAVARSLASIAAWSWPALINVVGLFAPSQRTTEEATNPLPFTVSVNAAPPTDPLAGDSDVRTTRPG